MDIRNFAMNYGAVLGFFLSSIAVVMWIFGFDERESIIPGLLNNGLTIGFISYAIIKYRDINNNGFISYSSSLKLGTSVAFFSSIILAFYSVIYVLYINPQALADLIVLTEQTMLEAKPDISEEELDLSLQMVSKMMKPHWMMIMGMLSGTLMGFLYSLVISIFTKRDDPNLIA